MSKKERGRKVILEQVLSGQMTRFDGASRLAISGRHLKRLLSRYRQFNDEGLVHKSRGVASKRAYPADKKALILSHYEEKYVGFGPTLASEKLLEDDGLKVHPETLRLWLIQAGLWKRHRVRKHHRLRRERRARYGALLQLDGSIHAWLSGSDDKQCLMNMVDDATGRTLAFLDTGETTRAAFSLLRWWVKEAGVPLAIYVDLKSVYVAPKSLRVDEDDELVEPEWLTHFSRACKKLGVTLIKAYSPQAKGRVERSHAVYQDRFVKELRLRKITTIEGANELLRNGFINNLNSKFAKPAADAQDAHVPLLAENDLEQIFCWEHERQVKQDWTFQFKTQHYQLEKRPGQALRPKQKIIVREHMDGTVSAWRGPMRLAMHKIEARMNVEKTKVEYTFEERSKVSTNNRHKTPWSQFNPQWLKPDKGAKGGLPRDL